MPRSALPIILFALIMWVIALMARLNDRSWVTPASLFALIWAAYCPTVLFFVSDASPYISGTLWILLSVSAVAAGAALASPLCRMPIHERRIASAHAIAALRPLIWVPIAVGLLDAAWLFLQRGVSVVQAFSLQAMVLVSVANRGEAYAGESDTPVLERIALTVLYLGTLYGGTLFRLSPRRRDKWLGFVALLALILISTLHGSRFGAIYGSTFWLSAFLATHVTLGDSKRGDKSGFLLRFSLSGVAIVFAFSLLTMLVRYSIFSDGENSVGWAYMLSDPFGFVAAFGLWFNEFGSHPDGPLLGARVFRRVAALWGAQFPLYEPVDVGFNTSNVFTIFRELIEDFSLVGSLEVLLFYGFFARVAFYAAGRSRGGVAFSMLVLVYAFAMTSVATSAFAYTTIVAASLLFIVSMGMLPSLAIVDAEEPEPELIAAPVPL